MHNINYSNVPVSSQASGRLPKQTSSKIFGKRKSEPLMVSAASSRSSVRKKQSMQQHSNIIVADNNVRIQLNLDNIQMNVPHDLQAPQVTADSNIVSNMKQEMALYNSFNMKNVSDKETR